MHHLSVRFPIRSGVPKCARESFTAVGDVSFTIAASQTLGLLGASGCSKTTAGKVIVQLLRGQAVIEGQALFQGAGPVRAVESIADHIVVMNAGRAEEAGPTDGVHSCLQKACTPASLAVVPRIQVVVAA